MNRWARCPFCGRVFEISDATPTTTVDGKRRYFCCPPPPPTVPRAKEPKPNGDAT